MVKRFIKSLLLLVLIASTIINQPLSFVPTVKANPDWLSGWSYRKSHVINSATGAGTLYQIKIRCYYGSGTDSGGSVYLNSHSRTDFGDVRFTDDDETTLLDYWMESKVDSNNAVFWVEVADDLSTVARTIFVYYGKSDATTTSNMTNTGIFGDGFDDGNVNGWTTTGTVTADSTIKRSGGYSMKIYTASGYGTSKSPAFSAQTAKCSFIYYVYAPAATGTRTGGIGPGTTDYFWLSIGQANNQFAYYWSGGWTNIETYTANQWYKIEMIVDINADTCLNLLIDEVSKATSKAFKNALASLTEVYFYENANTVYVDDVFMRKYVDPEPSHGSWGSEETSDTTPPTYSNVGTNTTLAGASCKFYTKWTDNVNMSGYIFGTNNTGTFTNDTWTGWSPVGTPKWSNVTKVLNNTVHIIVQWRIWANDTSDNWNNTGIQSLTTTGLFSRNLESTTQPSSLIAKWQGAVRKTDSVSTVVSSLQRGLSRVRAIMVYGAVSTIIERFTVGLKKAFQLVRIDIATTKTLSSKMGISQQTVFSVEVSGTINVQRSITQLVNIIAQISRQISLEELLNQPTLFQTWSLRSLTSKRSTEGMFEFVVSLSGAFGFVRTQLQPISSTAIFSRNIWLSRGISVVTTVFSEVERSLIRERDILQLLQPISNVNRWQLVNRAFSQNLVVSYVTSRFGVFIKQMVINIQLLGSVTATKVGIAHAFSISEYPSFQSIITRVTIFTRNVCGLIMGVSQVSLKFPRITMKLQQGILSIVGLKGILPEEEIISGTPWQEWVPIIVTPEIRVRCIWFPKAVSISIIHLLTNRLPLTVQMEMANKQNVTMTVQVRYYVTETNNTASIGGDKIIRQLSPNSTVLQTLTVEVPVSDGLFVMERRYTFHTYVTYDNQTTKEIMRDITIYRINVYVQVAFLAGCIVVGIIAFKEQKKIRKFIKDLIAPKVSEKPASKEVGASRKVLSSRR